MSEVIAWLRDLDSELVIEFVPKDDPMVKKLLLNRVDEFTDYDLRKFENWLSEGFIIKRREQLPTSSRILYHAVPSSA